MLSGNKDAFRRVPMPNLKRQLNSRSPTPNATGFDFNSVYSNAMTAEGRLPEIDANGMRRNSIGQRPPMTGTMDDVISTGPLTVQSNFKY